MPSLLQKDVRQNAVPALCEWRLDIAQSSRDARGGSRTRSPSSGDFPVFPESARGVPLHFHDMVITSNYDEQQQLPYIRS